jgi:hypothetical protein
MMIDIKKQRKFDVDTKRKNKRELNDSENILMIHNYNHNKHFIILKA